MITVTSGKFKPTFVFLTLGTADFTTTTVGSWVEVTGNSWGTLTIIPTFNCYLVFTGAPTVASNTASRAVHIALSKDDGATFDTYAFNNISTANEGSNTPFNKKLTLTAGITYTYKAYLFNANTGTAKLYYNYGEIGGFLVAR